MEPVYLSLYALVVGFVLDTTFGDPKNSFHPIVWIGNTISGLEKRLNKGTNRQLKGAIMTILLVGIIFVGNYFMIDYFNHSYFFISFYICTLIVFFSLSALTLREEVEMVFKACESSTEKGRKQLARIVGRDTNTLTAQQIKIAALETLSENLNDGVIAPLFWYATLGAPGMLAYKMINTLDSMIGYKNERYIHFGRFAAKLDDVVNYLPARITALLMLLMTNNLNKRKLVFKNGKNHASPNSGYPEAALASILNCRFGGPNKYFGELVEKPYIGDNERSINMNDLEIAIKTNRLTEFAMFTLTIVVILSIHIFTK